MGNSGELEFCLVLLEKRGCLKGGETTSVDMILIEFPLSFICIFLRFRHGYCKGNPRKMVKTWAEKEMRNLIR